MLELRILRSNGQAFQDLFVQVMGLRYPDFRGIKPQGQIGDRKNDGYSATDGRYFQVYAPEDHDESNVTATVKKLRNDFAGLKAYWDSLCPVREFYFVLNDKLRGTYPTVEACLLELKREHGLAACSPFLAKDLLRVFSELDSRAVMAITGHLPSSEQIPDLDYSVFRDLLIHVIGNPSVLTPAAMLRVPDFGEKIRLNGISEPVGALLRAGNLQSGAVDAFFSSHGGFSKRAIRDKLAEIYVDRRDQFNGHEQQAGISRGDWIFFSLLEAVTPASARATSQSAAIVLLAYFFETCDIYEDPNLL